MLGEAEFLEGALRGKWNSGAPCVARRVLVRT